MPKGCSRHVLLIAGLFIAALGIVIARNWGGVERTVSNMRAMQQGSGAARSLESPHDLLDYLAAHPDRASLVVLDAADPDAALRFEADAERPVAGLPTLLLLAEAVRQAEAGTLDADVSAADLAARRLPGTGARADTTAPGSAEDWMAWVARGDRAAESALLSRIGVRQVERQAEGLGLRTLEPPAPFEGTLLAWMTGDTTLDHAAALAEAHALADRLASSTAFRAETVQRLRDEGFPLTLDEQRLAAGATLPRGTAAGYAHLLALALQDSLHSPAVSARFLDLLDQTPPDSLGSAFTVLGTKGGGLPGYLTLAAFARTERHPEGRVAVLILADLPLAVFYHLVQTRLDSALVLALLADDGFVAEARRRLAPARSVTRPTAGR